MSRIGKSTGVVIVETDRHGGMIEQLFRSHAVWLHALLKRRLKMASSDIDDIVQDTYLRVARQPAELIGHPKAFLAQTALNLFRDSLRREAVRAGHRRASTFAAASVLTNPSDVTEQEAKLELERLIVEMPQPYRDVFVLSRFSHMTNADIARRLDLSVKAVEWRMGKALAFCMSRLRD